MHNIFRLAAVTLLLLTGSFCARAHVAYAATLGLSPNTGVYSVNTAFTVQVVINTAGKSVNAADAELSFNTHELSVISVSRASSIFNLWTQEPTFSNTSGTISLGGGSPTGYTGGAGNLATITFRALTAGTTNVSFKSGSILAADGMGTNVLASMGGGSYTINAATTNPTPEYITPPNTPAVPEITSTTHPDQTKWYKEATAEVNWKLPDGVTSIRTLLDNHPGTVPTIVYDKLFSNKTLDALSPGVSYFHIQFKNKNGWGKIAHFKFSIDSEPPSSFDLTEATSTDSQNPAHTLLFAVTSISPIVRYNIQINGAEPIVFNDTDGTKRYTLPALPPGHHTIVVEAFNSAGSSRIASLSIEIKSFEKPFFTEYPTRLNVGVIPAIKGTTRPHAVVTVTFAELGGGTTNATTTTNESGVFTVIPNGPLAEGIYDLTAHAVDIYSAQSDPSDKVRIIVEKPGYLQIGTLVVSVLSVMVPLIALVVVLIFGSWYLWHRLSSWRRRIKKETHEAEDELRIEFDEIIDHLHEKVTELNESRKGKLTKAEAALIAQIEGDLMSARAKINKEIVDIEEVIT